MKHHPEPIEVQQWRERGESARGLAVLALVGAIALIPPSLLHHWVFCAPIIPLLILYTIALRAASRAFHRASLWREFHAHRRAEDQCRGRGLRLHHHEQAEAVLAELRSKL